MDHCLVTVFEATLQYYVRHV